MATAPLDARERAELCDLFLDLGPAAPTLCEGWTTADLAAHLVIREREPLTGPGILAGGPFGRYTAKRQALQRARGFEQAVERIRNGPPALWRIGGLRSLLNLNEYYVHHEDVRRANGRTRRTDRADLDDALWAQLAKMARFSTRRIKPFGLELRRPEGASFVVRSADAMAVLTGHPSELALYLNGRRGAADVMVSGNGDAMTRLRQAKLGV